MKDIHKYFQIGTLQWMSYPELPASKAVEKIALDPYFDAVELASVPEPERAKVESLLKQSHITAVYGAHALQLGQGLNPNALTEEERRCAEDRLRSCIDEAAFMGARSAAFLAGRWEADRLREHLAQLVKTTVGLCRYAETKGIRMELEVFDYDVDKRVLIGPAALAAQFAEEVRKKCQNFGLLVDLSHIPLTHEKPEDVVRILKPYITHFHIGNAVLDRHSPAYGDQHPRFGYPGGESDVSELCDFLRILRREGFFREKDRMLLSFEVKPRAGEDADAVLAGCKRTLNAAWMAL